MEHYRSTLGTAALAVFGLVVAARVLHPGNYEAQPRLARSVPVQAEVVPTAAWTNPPATLRLNPDASAVDAATLAPRLTMALPHGATMAPALPAKMAAAVGEPRRSSTARRRTTQRGTRVRQAALLRVPAAQPEQTAR